MLERKGLAPRHSVPDSLAEAEQLLCNVVADTPRLVLRELLDSRHHVR